MKWILYTSLLSPILPVLAGLVKGRRCLVWYYTLFGLLLDNLAFLLKCLHFTGYKAFNNIYLIVEFIFLSFIYLKEINIPMKIIIFYTLLSLIIFSFHTISNSIFNFNFLFAALFLISYIIYSLLGFHKIIRSSYFNITKDGLFWLNVTTIIYSSGAFLLVVFLYYLNEDYKETLTLLWTYIFLSLNILKYILLAPAVLYFKTNNTDAK